MTTARAPLKAGSQCEVILRWLVSGHSLTVAQAFRKWDITAAGQRIGELKRRGHEIEGEMVKTRGGAMVKRWRLRH
jgi:hypothetical protein